MLAALAALSALVALPFTGDAHKDYLKRQRTVLVEAGGRHLDLGLWCRDKGLVPQATTEFILAVETSEGAHPGANIVLSYMRSLQGKFWKKRKPSRSALASYDKKARKARLDDREERLDLALWAHKKKLHEQAEEDVVALLRASDEPLEFDKKGRLVIDAGTIPEQVSQPFRDAAVSINGRLYLRDGVLSHLPDVAAVAETTTDVLRVRADTIDAELVDDLHALGTALLAILADELEGAPTYRLNTFVFAERAAYEGYLDAIGLSSHKVATGLADGGTATALICGEGLDEDGLRGVVLHELTHLASFAVNRSVTPSWYSEGLAELYGARESFTWNGAELELGLALPPGRMASLRSGELMPLEEFLASDALTLLRQSPEAGNRFYAQSWAFVRFLRQGAVPEVRETFADWERYCRGASLGAVVGDPRSTHSAPAAELFEQMMAEQLPMLEESFQAYVAGL
jgi:hypothetical protein